MINNDDIYENREIDLHNYSTGVALDIFITYYNSEIENGLSGGSIKVIHGFHGHEIRTRLRTFLKENSSCLDFEFGENIDRNEGYTMVYPKLHLPPISNILSGKILVFCAIGVKSEEKIFGEFRLYGDAEVKKAIKLLEWQKKIHSKYKGRTKVYEIVIP